MRRLLGMAGALLGVALATGCTTDHDASEPPPEEMSRDRTREVVREVAAKAVREQFGALPAPRREYESRCDGVPWIDDDRAYVMGGLWELPLAPEDHEPTLLALYRGFGQVETRFTKLGGGRFSLDGFDPETSIGYTVTSDEPPTTVRLSVSSSCRLDPE